MLMKPKYLANPIGTVELLATVLGVDLHALQKLAEAASGRYHEFEIDKKTGGKRKITAPDFDLKLVQKRINRFVFSNVQYPDYLFGGIAEKDYLRNAQVHVGAKVLIAVDVESFYPNIKASTVKKIFQYFCNFSPEVSDVLTRLTTLNGAVPQGACTSSHLANLVFHETEHALVHEFRQKGLKYSRLLDDITVSSKSELSAAKIAKNIDRVAAMLKTVNCRIKKSKTKISSESNPSDLMFVTGLWLNRGRPRVASSERDLIRSEVYNCLKLASVSRHVSDYHAKHDRVSGRVAKLAYVGHKEAVVFRRQLSAVLPLFDKNDENKTKILAQVLSRSSAEARSKISYFERFHQVMHRANKHVRNNPKFAAEIRGILKKVTPLISREAAEYGE